VTGTALAAPVYAADSPPSDTSGGTGHSGQSNNHGATPAAPADRSPSASGTRGDTGYYGQVYGPGEAPAVPGEATPAARARSYAAPDVSGLAYQPGFNGCAPRALISTVGGFRTALEPLPSATPKKNGRYLRFGLTAGETYTDNVALAGDDNAKTAWVTQLVPSLSACANSGRIRGSLDYQLQGLLYADSNETDKVYNHVAADTTIEVLPGHLFLAADTTYGQTVINPEDVFSHNNLLRPGNRTSAWISNVSPYWFQPLGFLGNATLRYRYGRAQYGRSSVSNYTLNGASFHLASPRSNPVWSYQINARTQRVKRDNVPASRRRFFLNNNKGDVTYFDRAMLQLGYQLTPSLQLLAAGGAEDDYHRDGSNDRLGSAVWNVGFRWSSPRNALEARYGKRSFGSYYSVEATHRAQAFNLRLAYREDRTMAGLNQLDRGSNGALGAFRSPLAPIRDRGVYVRKRWSGRVAFHASRTKTTLTAYRESRDYLTTDEPNEKVYGARLDIHYRLGARTALLPRVRYRHQDYGKRDQDDGKNRANIIDAGVGLTYLVTPSSQAAVSYSHAWRDGETRAGSYDENRVTVQYSIFF
jgi:hypothetical protein